MEKSHKSPSFDRFRSRSRKPVRVSQEELTRSAPLPESDDPDFMLKIEPAMENVSLSSWAETSRDSILERLHRHGAILFRGFGIEPDGFRDVARAITPDLLDYRERAAPRHEVKQNVYTSTEFPSDQVIPLHHEMSYSHNWPKQIFFYCQQAAQQGGRTPIANDRAVIDRLDPEVKERFRSKGVMYVRNYGEGVDLPWREAFQTDDKEEVEAYCRRAGMKVEWRDRDRLRTWSKRQVFATHPDTGDTVWFNHAHLFHMSNLGPEVREALLSEFEPDELPRNAFHADGSAIDEGDLDHIRDVYEGIAVRFPWQEGDLLLVDNFLVSHGRESYEGPRTVLVAMAELYTNTEVTESAE